MKAANQFLITIGLALASAHPVMAAQQSEADSAYKWGRWAVLSPAAGGSEPYAEAATPGADFNARPGEAEPFQPLLAGSGGGPIVSPPTVAPNPPGAPPPIGDPRLRPPGISPNPIGSEPPLGDGRVR
jgi:hypothetical protein